MFGSIVWYFTNQQSVVSLLLVFIQNVVNQVFLLNIQFTLLDIKVAPRKILLCACCVSLLYLLPLYLVDFFLFSPGLYFSVWLYSMLMFINPVSALVYYLVIKHVLNLSPTKNCIVLRNQLLMHYVVVLVYMLMNNITIGLVPNVFFLPRFFMHEFVSIVLTVVYLALCLWVVRIYVRRTRKYLTIPPDYSENHVRNLRHTFLALSAFYGVIVFFRCTWLDSNFAPFNLNVVFMYSLLVALVLCYLMISTLQLRAKLLNWEMQTKGTYISSLLHANQQFRAIKHDFYNVLQTYGGYLDIADYPGLRRYHEELFRTTKMAGDFLSLIEALKSRVAVYSLIEAKAERAHTAGVLFSINQLCDITDVALTDIDLCRVLGVVIDNAIEAAAESENKQVSLSFERKDKNTMVFAISNSTRGEVDTSRIFDSGYTTKASHTGIGLSQVTRILNSYEHCMAIASYHGDQFTLFLALAAPEGARRSAVRKDGSPPVA